MTAIMDLLERLKEQDPGLELAEEMFPLFWTKVPLIICRFKNGLALDIQVPDANFHAIRNTNLIRHYVAVSRAASGGQGLRSGRRPLPPALPVRAGVVQRAGPEEQQGGPVVQLPHHPSGHPLPAEPDGECGLGL